MQRPSALLIPILALVVACRGGGSGPTQPVEPTIRMVSPPPCQSQPPVDPGPVLRAIPACEDGVDGTCPPLSPGQFDAIWLYIEALEDWAHASWRCEQARARRLRGVPGGGGTSSNAADP